VRLADELEQRLVAPKGGYYMAAPRPGLLFQPLSVTDGAIPSGNAVAIHDLRALAELTHEPRFRERAERNLRAFARELEQYPGAVPMLAAAVVRGVGDTASTPVASREVQPERAGAGAMDELARQVVETAATAGEPVGGWRPLELRLRIRKGWHVNANPASEDFLIPTGVEGEVRGLQYPDGKPFRFTFSEAPLEVYEGEVVLRGEVASGARDVRVTYQACDANRCLRPVTLTLPLGGGGRR